MANSTYNSSIMPQELRISDADWERFLSHWESEQLLIFKKTFLQYGLAYSEFRPYIANLQGQTLKLELSRKVISDMLHYPGRDVHERTEGERRLQEARQRLALLLERLPETELSVVHQAIMRDSLRFPPATETDIQAAESRLGVRFPPSYSEFLGITNGWLIEQQPSISPVEKVVPLREVDPDYVQAWLEHKYLHETGEFVVTPEPLGEGEAFINRNLDIPTTCLNEALVIGMDEREKAFLLLDPTTVDERGEWRAISLFRYEFAIVGRDFARLMEILYRLNAQR